MERKIGEIFEYNGELYQCVNGFECTKCDLHQNKRCTARYNDIGSCSKNSRKDNTPVIFKKLEKVGEPYNFQKRTFQTYKLHTIPFLSEDVELVAITSKDNNTIEIEIKQNKEDMEEKNKAEGLPLLRLVGKYMNSLINYATFEKAVKDLYSNKEESKPTLKEFDLEAAKKGKPVCTRDGKKARIICFDRIDNTGCNLPIVALIQVDETEVLQLYHDDGKCDIKADLDLMMLPEKKEGWVKIRKDINLYDTKEEADRKMIGNDEYVTAKVFWEE